MRSITILMSTLISINLAGCATTARVVPKQGPVMEQVYDGMGQPSAVVHPAQTDNLQVIRAEVTRAPASASSIAKTVPYYRTAQSFKKLPDPELKMLVFPHLAGSDEVPVPGYTTAFNAYEREHYALPGDGE